MGQQGHPAAPKIAVHEFERILAAINIVVAQEPELLAAPQEIGFGEAKTRPCFTAAP